MWITRRNRYGRRRTVWRTHARRTRGQTRRLVRIWTAAAVLLLALAAAFLLLRGGARPKFEEGELQATVNSGGDVELHWPESDVLSALYEVKYSCGETQGTRYCSQPSLRLSGLPAGEALELQVRIQANRKGLFGGSRRVNSWKTLRTELVLPKEPEIPAEASNLPSGGALALTYQETAPRLCVLEWNGTQCHHFEVQRRAGEAWETVARLAPEERMRYDPGRLGSGSYNRFRVAAVDGDGAELQAEEVSFWASVSPLYATVWPIENMNFWENPSGGVRLGSIPGGTALCVLAEEGNWFRVRYGEEYGWVDSRYCMIDLPEYVGDHCTYDITNSYDSLFAVHGSPIKEVTHQVLPGYEDVQLADGSFLVPYLYPCAKKLLTAAQAAEADGLRLKIYEAFRPQRATRFSYDTTEKQLRDPALTESGGQVGMTLSRLMTDNGRFNLGSFLARTISSHNRGIALDLTLEKIDGGEELEMQSVIHDLSWYSETYLNTLNAKLLEGYMKAVGMNGLSSEWWHFQDDDTRKSISLNSSLEKGVSPEGWTQDDGGWRYRRADGSFVHDAALTVDGRAYTFDGSGYAAG